MLPVLRRQDAASNPEQARADKLDMVACQTMPERSFKETSHRLTVGKIPQSLFDHTAVQVSRPATWLALVLTGNSTVPMVPYRPVQGTVSGQLDFSDVRCAELPCGRGTCVSFVQQLHRRCVEGAIRCIE